MAIRRMHVGPRYGERKINSRMSRKLAGLLGMVVLLFVCLAVRITYINAVSGEQYARQVLAQSQGEYASTILPFKRGDIQDANGMTLATSEKRYNVILDCRVVNSDEKYLEPTIEALSEYFNVDVVGVRALLSDEKTKDSQYQVVSRNVPVEEKQAYDRYKKPDDETKKKLSKEEIAARDNIKGIWFEENYIRVYPFNSLACDVIGFTNGDNSADWGIEGYYTNTLNGVDGRKYGYWDNDDLTQTIIEPTDGRSLVSTIDVNIQQIIEDEIASFSDKYANGPNGAKAAKNIGVVVMDPQTGSILGMGSSDSYDLNNPRDLSQYYTAAEIAAMTSEEKVENLQKLWRNYCISDAYEPGSVVKPVTVASAFECGSINGSEEFVCDGGQDVAGVYIKCSDINGHGTESVSDAIRNSCNDALMQIAEKMGQEEFCKYQRLFNFGSRTGIDLSGEASGILFESSAMSDVDLATSSFGQGFTCTMIQEISAIASVINGGNYYQPHVISKVLDSDGSIIKTIEPTLQKQTVSEEVSDELRSYMKASVDSGTSVYSKVDGYSMGGKTGTAQKLPRGNGKYLVSYIGFAPYDDPQVLIYVVIDEPNVAEQADSRFPQWMAKNILGKVLPYMNIYPDEPLRGEDPNLAEPDYEDEAEGTPVEDTPSDLNVPAPDGEGSNNENPNGGNTPQDAGLTNEEAGVNNTNE